MDGARHTDRRVQAKPGLFTPEAAQNYLGGNFARFAAEAYTSACSARAHMTLSSWARRSCCCWF